MIYKYKLTYGYGNSKEKIIRYFSDKGLMDSYIRIGKENNLKALKIEEVKTLDDVITQELVEDIKNSNKKEVNHTIGSIKITVIKNFKEIIIYAVNENTERNLNLYNQKYIKLRKLLIEIGKVIPGIKNGIKIELTNDTYDTEKEVSNNIYGYCRVSTKGQLENNSLEQQKEEIIDRYSNAKCYAETYTGKTIDRPIFNKLLKELYTGDTLVVTKLDRLCRSTREGLEIIEKLKEKGIRIHILNMGLIEDTPMGNLIVTNLLAFAEFERAMIVERTQAGKAIAKTKENFREGRPKKFTKKQVDHALSLLSINGGDRSYKEVEEITGISKSTLIRAMRKMIY